MRYEQLLAVAIGLGACSAVTSFDTSFLDDPPGDGDADSDADTDGDTDGDGDTDADGDGDADPGVTVDILMMVDNSPSMAEEQSNLTGSLRQLLEALTDPPDEDQDGQLDYRFVTDLHLGVISSDMGSGGYDVAGCPNPDGGDAGALRHEPSPDLPRCDPAYPSFLTYEVRQPDLGIDDDFTCIATLGTGGCGFEQPLWAIVAALDPEFSGGGANAGFVRDRAALAIVILSDEDDCSAADEGLYDVADLFLGNPNTRCSEHPEMLLPLDDLASAVVALKPDPHRVNLVAIVGVPAPLVELSPARLRAREIQTDADFARILDDPSMEVALDPDNPGNLSPSCDEPDLGRAFPPQRIVGTLRQAHQRGAGAVAQSICQADYSGAMQALARMVGAR